MVRYRPLARYQLSLKQERPCFIGKKSHPSLLVIDSQSVRGTAGRQENKGVDGYKKINGHKRHILVDTLGLIHACHVTSANTHDSKACEETVEACERNQSLHRCAKILADKAYVGDLEILLDLRFNINLEIGSSEACSKRFIPEPKRWIVERTIAWLNKCRRLVKNYEQKISSMKAWVYIANAFIGLKKIDLLI